MANYLPRLIIIIDLDTFFVFFFLNFCWNSQNKYKKTSCKKKISLLHFIRKFSQTFLTNKTQSADFKKKGPFPLIFFYLHENQGFF